MKVAILVKFFLPQYFGGVEIATYNIAEILSRRGYEVYVVTSLDKELPLKRMEENFHIYRFFGQRIKIIGIISFWIRAFWLLKKINPDVIHVQGIENGISAFLLKKIMKKPYVVYGHGSEIYLSGILKKKILKVVLKNANVVIALTEDMKNKIKDIYYREVFVVPNGINYENFKDLSREKVRRELKISNDEKIIIFVGRYHAVKGIKYLIQAMNIVNRKLQKIKLLLIGNGRERKKIEMLVNKLGLERGVRFVREVPNKEIPKYMVASDIFILPSLSEGFPIVILEAFACGLPIIATKVGGIPEIIKEGINGFLVKPRDPEAIAERVMHLLQDDQLRNKISNENVRESYLYSWNRVIKELEAIYAQVIKHN